MFEIRLTGGPEGQDSVGRIIQVHEEFKPKSFWPELVRTIIHPWFLETARDNITGLGMLAGESWNYSTEPMYAAYKRDLVGHLWPMRWSPGMERLFPGLTDAKSEWHIFKMGKLSVRIGVGLPYALRLTQGGVGPFGEPFPGRSLMPSVARQKTRLMKRILRWMKARFSHYREQRIV